MDVDRMEDSDCPFTSDGWQNYDYVEDLGMQRVCQNYENHVEWGLKTQGGGFVGSSINNKNFSMY